MIHILCTDISGIDDTQYGLLYRAASFQRQQRADRFRNREDSIRCIAAEVLLRTALSRRFGQWHNCTISSTPQGKPYLTGQTDFHFSISHSGRWVVLAYGSTELGIDIQLVDPQKARPTMVKRIFTPEEQRFLSQGHPTDFFRLWTGKESYLKYLGTGLSKSLISFSVLSPETGIHYFWEMLDEHVLCLCTREQQYRLEQICIKNAPAL